MRASRVVIRREEAAMSPHAPRRYVFFDVDETLISIKSMLSFQEYWFAATGDLSGKILFEEEMARLRRGGASREALNRRYYAHFAGREVAAVEQRATGWFNHVATTIPGLFHSAVVAALYRHQNQGDRAVLVSGSFPALLTPIARRLGVRDILATDLVTAHGRYTGEIRPPQTIGAGKAEVIARFLAARRVPAAQCHAYGDDLSDLPMLDAVGHPVVVRGSGELEAQARQRGWPVLSPVWEA